MSVQSFQERERMSELQETVRQYRFKTRAMGKLIEYAMERLPKGESEAIGSGLMSLLMHTAGEHPLTFEFNGRKVEEP
jgi:hypothetical protein